MQNTIKSFKNRKKNFYFLIFAGFSKLFRKVAYNYTHHSPSEKRRRCFIYIVYADLPLEFKKFCIKKFIFSIYKLSRKSCV